MSVSAVPYCVIYTSCSRSIPSMQPATKLHRWNQLDMTYVPSWNYMTPWTPAMSIGSLWHPHLEAHAPN